MLLNNSSLYNSYIGINAPCIYHLLYNDIHISYLVHIRHILCSLQFLETLKLHDKTFLFLTADLTKRVVWQATAFA